MFSIRFILNILYTYVTFEYTSHLEKNIKKGGGERKNYTDLETKQLMFLCCANKFYI